MSGSYSKYNPIKTSRVPRRKRTIKMQGSGEDDGKWYRCWYCGFINNIDRNTLGDGEGLDFSVGVEGNDIKLNDTKGYLLGGKGKMVLMSSTHLFFERHNVGSYAVSGCSLCGCRNYR